MRNAPTCVLATWVIVALLSPPAPAGDGDSPPGRGVYLVFLEEDALATYRGGVPGLRSPRVPGGRGLDPRSAESRSYLAWLEARQQDHLDRLEAALGRRPEVPFRYRAAANGLAIRLTAAEAARVRSLPGVTEVVADHLLPLDTDRGPAFIGASEIWDGTALGGPGIEGEGVIVGIIDTGVNMSHPAFSDAPVDGHTYTNPFGSGNFVGWCDPANPNHNPAFVCNDKLIGAWDFADAVSVDSDGPEDNDGHGSHTASTAAGNPVDYSGDGVPDMFGVAPHANLITYDACYVDPGTGLGLCPFSATSASVDQAILDGVDAINYSIGGGGNPWSSGDIDRFFLNAVGAGIFVAASAGNSGPGASTTGHLGPWVTTVGASTLDRVNVENQLVNMSGGTSPPADISGASRTQGYGPAPIVYAGDFSNGDANPEQCLSPFPPGTFSGQIVVCDRGSLARVMKGQNVLDGGAGGFVLANVSGGATSTVDDAHVLPAIHVSLTGGNALRTWLAGGSGHTATITPGTMQLNGPDGDNMASFSSRGPNPSFDVIKPDVTNPGVSILAAYRAGFLDEPGLPPYEGLELAFLSGTSMSSPHTAGAGALLRSVHPAWTPSEIKSALMTTATRSVVKENGVTPADPFDMGGGRVDLARAVQAGLLLDETQADFLAANPALSGDPRTLNLATLADDACGAFCSWTRTVESPLSTSVTWTASGTGPAWMTFDIQPAMFTLAPGASQALDIEVGAAGGPTGAWAFAEILLTPDDPTIPEAHLTVAVRPIGVPDLQLDGQRFSDTALGNGDGVLDPFEVITLEVDLRNVGPTTATGISGVLSTTTPGVTVLDPQATWSAIGPSLVGTTQLPHFQVEIGGTVPCGSTVDFVLDVTADHGPSQYLFQLSVGQVNSPAGNYPSVDTPLAIPDNDPAGVSSIIEIADAYDIANINVTLGVTHPRIADLEIDLISPLGTAVRLHDRSGGTAANLNTTYDQITAPDGPGTMSDLDGESVNGTWTLRVVDARNNNTGQIDYWSITIIGVVTTDCSPVPCAVSASASATPTTICAGETVLVSGAGSLAAGSDCSGTLEYRFEDGPTLLQDWSTDLDVQHQPPASTTYTVRVRDAGTLTEKPAFTPVTVNPLPNPTVVQTPSTVCTEVGDVNLEGGPGFATYTWRDESSTIIGTSQVLSITETACQGQVSLDVTTAAGCSSGTGLFPVACEVCTPAEVSAAGSAVPFRMGLDAAGTVEFEILPDPGVTYTLYNADTIPSMLAGDYAWRICDIENGTFGTFNVVNATTARWTPMDPVVILEGNWVVVAEHPSGFESPYGFGSGGTPRPPDSDGMGSVGNLDCP